MEIVPQLWLLTRRAQSRIFQHETRARHPEAGAARAWTSPSSSRATFHPRDYCVQYRETDFDFASRLMEEEGIYYFFKHTADGHKLVLANTPAAAIPTCPAEPRSIYDEVEGGNRDDDARHRLGEDAGDPLRQGTRSGTTASSCRTSTWRPTRRSRSRVQVGTVTHKLKVAGNDQLEIYDYPGGYAQRFDGIDQGGGEQPADLQKIFEDNQRTAGIRMQQEAVPEPGDPRREQLPAVHGRAQVHAGPALQRRRRLRADHASSTRARLTGDYRSGAATGAASTRTRFTLHPARPAVPAAADDAQADRSHGTQTAIVVGPPGEEIFPTSTAG